MIEFLSLILCIELRGMEVDGADKNDLTKCSASNQSFNSFTFLPWMNDDWMQSGMK